MQGLRQRNSIQPGGDQEPRQEEPQDDPYTVQGLDSTANKCSEEPYAITFISDGCIDGRTDGKSNL